MRFQETGLEGAWLVQPTRMSDGRGFFSRTFCERLFGAKGLETRFVQHSVSYSRALGTLRGMHFQQEPYAETKLVSCRKGAIYDIIVDLRVDSPTFRKWKAFELTAESGHQLYVPRGFAHGFQTLVEDVEVGYLISAFYEPQASGGFRHDDPAIGISWPLAPTAMSQRDQTWPDLSLSRTIWVRGALVHEQATKPAAFRASEEFGQT